MLRKIAGVACSTNRASLALLHHEMRPHGDCLSRLRCTNRGSPDRRRALARTPAGESSWRQLGIAAEDLRHDECRRSDNVARERVKSRQLRRAEHLTSSRTRLDLIL